MKEAPSHRMRVTASTICHHLNSPERHYFHHKRPFLNFHYGCSYNHSSSTCAPSLLGRRGGKSGKGSAASEESESARRRRRTSEGANNSSPSDQGCQRASSERSLQSCSSSPVRRGDNKSYVRRSKHEYLVTTTALLCVMSLVLCRQLCDASWDQWWTYDGISGPSFWGRLNPKWNLCSKGKKQSPIDVNPAHLLFDPSLASLDITGNEVSGNLTNTGRGIVFKVAPKLTDLDPEVTISAGPLSYRYTLHHLELHFGRDISRGSEHSIDSFRYPGEIQAYFFNSQLYSNWDESVVRAHGIAAIAVLIQLNSDGKKANPSLRRITQTLKNITVKGNSEPLTGFSMQELMPSEARRQYLTYEGSLTQPSCQETVQWILLNKPIYMTSHLFHSLRTAMSSENSHGADNFRPTQKLNSRTVRTNIDFVAPHSHHQMHSNSSNAQVAGGGNKMCSMKRSLFTYKANLKSFPGDLD